MMSSHRAIITWQLICTHNLIYILNSWGDFSLTLHMNLTYSYSWETVEYMILLVSWLLPWWMGITTVSTLVAAISFIASRFHKNSSLICINIVSLFKFVHMIDNEQVITIQKKVTKARSHTVPYCQSQWGLSVWFASHTSEWMKKSHCLILCRSEIAIAQH